MRPKLILNRFFRLIIIILAAAAGLVCISPLFGINELVYPAKIDSAFVASNQKKFISAKTTPDSSLLFFYHPSQISRNFQELDVTAPDSIILKGWLIESQTENPQTIIVFIHDINEGKLIYLDAARSFSERGFHVCLFDMRAHGESGGIYFSMGSTAVMDISKMISRLEENYPGMNIVLFGNGAGATLALQSAMLHPEIKMLILRNIFESPGSYFLVFAREKWGILADLLFPVMKRELENQTGIKADSLNLDAAIERLSVPVIFLADEHFGKKQIEKQEQLYEKTAHDKKLFLAAADWNYRTMNTSTQKLFFDRLSLYININSMPDRETTRFRKLVLGSSK